MSGKGASTQFFPTVQSGFSFALSYDNMGVSVRSRGGSKPMSECSDRRRPYVQRGERVLYFLAPMWLCRGYKLAREGGEPKSQRERKKEYIGDCLRC
jgi:hypothetical protein